MCESPKDRRGLKSWVWMRLLGSKAGMQTDEDLGTILKEGLGHKDKPSWHLYSVHLLTCLFTCLQLFSPEDCKLSGAKTASLLMSNVSTQGLIQNLA